MIPSQDDTTSQNKTLIAKKIRALLAKTTEAGCSEAEALMAMDKAHELLAKHQLSLSDLDLREEGTSHKKATKDYRGIGKRIASRVALFCDCKVWTSDAEINFIGLDSDAQLCEWLLAALVGFVQRSALEWKAETGETIPNIVDSFIQGTIDRLNRRLRVETERRQVNAKPSQNSGRDLVPLKNAMIDEAMAKLGLRLEYRLLTRAEITSKAAFEAGKEAGDRASFHRPIRSTETLMIGGK